MGFFIAPLKNHHPQHQHGALQRADRDLSPHLLRRFNMQKKMMFCL
jgi:hypothetical protein